MMSLVMIRFALGSYNILYNASNGSVSPSNLSFSLG